MTCSHCNLFMLVLSALQIKTPSKCHASSPPGISKISVTPISHQFKYMIFCISGYKSLVYSNPLDCRVKNSLNSFSVYEEIQKQLQHAALISISSQWGSANSISHLILWNPSLCPHPLDQAQK